MSSELINHHLVQNPPGGPPVPTHIRLGKWSCVVRVAPEALDGADGTYERDKRGKCTITLEGWGCPVHSSTLLHESLHFMDDILGIGLNEHQVRAFEFGLVEALRENPGLWYSLRYLVEGGDELAPDP